MTKKSYETFCAYLDVLSGNLSYAKTSRALKHHERLIYAWIAQSKAAKEAKNLQSEFFFEYLGETKFLHQHIKDVVSASIEEIESAARSRARDGHWTVAMFQGQTVFKRDPALIGRPDLVELFGLPDDLLRDENGALVPEMIWHPPSTDLVQMVLQAHTQKYRRQSTSNVTLDINNRHSGGVMVAGGFPAKAIEQSPLPMLQIVEQQPEPITAERYAEPDADYVEADADADADADDEAQPMATEPEPEPEPVQQPTPAPANLTPLQRDLLARMRAPVGDAARIAPIPKQNPDRDPDDYDARRVGAGEPPAGAVKVV